MTEPSASSEEPSADFVVGRMASGALGVAVASVYIWASLQFPIGGLERPGAGGFPLLVAVLLWVLCLASFLQGLRHWRRRRPEALGRIPHPRRMWVFVTALLIYVIALPIGGYVASTAILIAFLTWLLEPELRVVRIVIFGIVAAILLYIAFVHGFAVRLPLGPLGW